MGLVKAQLAQTNSSLVNLGPH